MNDLITMAHGSGGKTTHQLIAEIFRPAFENIILSQGNDSANLGAIEGQLITTVDSHVITPLFFPGGDIGKLAVCGTINDLATSGATPLFLTVSFILEEGFPLQDLKLLAESMGKMARECQVKIVTGDTKVVERGHGDGAYITTTGIGVIPYDRAPMHESAIRPGDKVLISGSVGDHGVAIMSFREGLTFESSLQSDCAPLHTLVARLLTDVPDTRILRDPTRGGVSATCNELAHATNLGIELWEEKMPIKAEVKSACDFLGLDPLNLANEGKMLAIVPAHQAENALAAFRSHPLGREAAIIGVVNHNNAALVTQKTLYGGTRVIHWQSGEILPRIC